MNDEKSKLDKEITLKLIRDHNVPKRSSMSADDIADALGKLTHIRLDRLQITKIENLDCLGPVTNLYLQQNFIERIENLEALRSLRFLTLSGNKIRKIENLRHLQSLKFLDLSFNCIEHCPTGELPPSLMILSLKGNPCVKEQDYRSGIIRELANLKELDEIPVNQIDGGDGNDDHHSSGEDRFVNEIEDKDMDVLEEANSLKETSGDIIARLKIRSLKQKEQHNDRMAELNSPRLG
ncbi:leucine-rich repeat-containing protein 46-like [Dendronephthya gigantea]|uniref:leucine-rich repeat-containing protein 46-like n=1 Tax=Dendronephthya gigantea TaxID=151771 RepID=UPI0010691E55|nr:leucine-rich repeat-containing protein 46-like [Dendronephthya gigantea]